VDNPKKDGTLKRRESVIFNEMVSGKSEGDKIKIGRK
jgi:hypothetical protein